jgi:hypothetical protein
VARASSCTDRMICPQGPDNIIRWKSSMGDELRWMFEGTLVEWNWAVQIISSPCYMRRPRCLAWPSYRCGSLKPRSSALEVGMEIEDN